MKRDYCWGESIRIGGFMILYNTFGDGFIYKVIIDLREREERFS